MPSNAAWVRAAIANNETRLLRYAADIVGQSLARDVVQDTFLRLIATERASIEGHLVAWLFTVCRNRALEMRRKVRPLTELDPQTPGDGPLHSDTFEHAESVKRVRRGLQALPAKQREVVRLKFDAELSYKEIAEVTGLSASNVGFILHTALARLRKDMAEEDEREPLAVRRAQ